MIAAIVGDAVPRRLATLFTAALGAWPKPSVFVSERCEQPVGKGYWCLSCRTFLANEGQRELHVETGEHVIAHACELHGAEAVACQ